MKRLRGIALILSLLFCISACTSANPPASSTPSEGNASITEVPSVPPLEPAEFSMFHVMSGNVPDDFSYSNNWMINYICEQANVTLTEVQVPAYADTATQFDLMMASNQQLDLINYSSTKDMLKYGKDGAFLESASLIKSSEKLSKKITDDMIRYAASEDGVTYIFPTQAATDYNSFFIRKDLLESVGISKLPETLDELVAAAKAIKAKYPDSLPFAGAGLSARSSWIFKPFNTNYNGWTYDAEINAYRQNWEGNNIVECLKWAKGLYDEDLLDPEFLTTNTDDDNTKKATRNVFLYWGNMGSIRVWLQRVNNVESNKGVCKLIPIAVPEAENVTGAPYTVYNGTIGGYCFGISSKVKDEAKLAGILRFLEVAYSDDIVTLSSYGRENEEYTLVDGTVTPKLPNAVDNAWIAIYGWCSFNSREKLEYQQNIVIQQTAVGMSDSEKTSYSNELITAINDLDSYYRKNSGYDPTYGISPLPDEIKNLETECNEAQSSLFVKALIGEISIDEFISQKDALITKYQKVTDTYNELYQQLKKN